MAGKFRKRKWFVGGAEGKKRLKPPEISLIFIVVDLVDSD